MNTNRLIASGLLALSICGLSQPSWALKDRADYVDICQTSGNLMTDSKILVEAVNGNTAQSAAVTACNTTWR